MVTLLRVAALVEVVSLAVLLGNLVTAHLDVVAGIVGPLHGAAYVSVIATTLLLPVRSAVRVRALLPGIGGLLRPAARSAADRGRGCRRRSRSGAA
jgi:hypothetical protein